MKKTDLSILDDMKLLIFDGDGTLWEWKTWKLLKNVEPYFKYIHDSRRHKLALASNQGGVGTRYWMEVGHWGSPQDFPTTIEVEEEVSQITAALGHEWFIGLCYTFFNKRNKTWCPVPPEPLFPERWRQDWRKPNAGMLDAAMVHYEISPEHTLMIGDWPEDEEAAKKAGCFFMHADEFFRRGEHYE